MTPEQLRRSGNPAGAVDLCRDALARFPGHVSARVTLGWALIDLGRLKEAREELLVARRVAPDNLAAIRGLAQLHVLDEEQDSDRPYTFEDAEASEESPTGAEPAKAVEVPEVVEAAQTPETEEAEDSAVSQVGSASPAVVRLETWLSRVEALKTAV